MPQKRRRSQPAATTDAIDAAIRQAAARAVSFEDSVFDADIDQSIASVVQFSDEEVEAIRRDASVRDAAAQVFKLAARSYIRDTFAMAMLVAKQDEGREKIVTESHAVKAVRLSRRANQDSKIGQICLVIGGILTGLGGDKAWEALVGKAIVEPVALWCLIAGIAVLVWGLVSVFARND